MLYSAFSLCHLGLDTAWTNIANSEWKLVSQCHSYIVGRYGGLFCLFFHDIWSINETKTAKTMTSFFQGFTHRTALNPVKQDCDVMDHKNTECCHIAHVYIYPVLSVGCFELLSATWGFLTRLFLQDLTVGKRVCEDILALPLYGWTLPGRAFYLGISTVKGQWESFCSHLHLPFHLCPTAAERDKSEGLHGVPATFISVSFKDTLSVCAVLSLLITSQTWPLLRLGHNEMSSDVNRAACN